MAEFDPVTGRITLTKAHIASEQGKRLIQLILEIGLDGQLSDAELTRLSVWLKTAPQEIPAIRHLQELVSDALNDGVISEDERKILHKQIERVIPSTERERLAIARKAFQEKKRAEERERAEGDRVEREKLREEERTERDRERERQQREYSKATEPQRRYIKGLGGYLPPDATKQDASEIIERLLHSNGSITPRQQMVLRFWSITPQPKWGKAQVSVWMDQWYEEDPDRQVAWELFKEGSGDTGTSLDPERVPFGAGYAYLRKVKSAGKTTHPSPGEERPKVPRFWLFAAAMIVLVVIGTAIFKGNKAPTVSAPNTQQTSAVRLLEQPTSPIPAAEEPAASAALQQPAHKALSKVAALEALNRNGYQEKPLQIPATIIDVGILKYVPYLSYRIGNDRELNIYGDPEIPACIEIGLYRSLLESVQEKKRCVTFLQEIYPDLDFKAVGLTASKSLTGSWVIEVTMPDSPDAYGGWWISVYNLDRLHKAAGTSANISVVSETASSSSDWTPQELSYARPATSASPASNHSSSRVYVKSYYRENGTYVRSHSRRR